jgi:hypothetical protein
MLYEHASIFINKFFKCCILGILYNAIMHKRRFGQSHRRDLLEKSVRKFMLYFSDFSTTFYEFMKFELIYGKLKRLTKFEKGKQCWASFGSTVAWPNRPRGPVWLAQPMDNSSLAGPCHTAHMARAQRGHCARNGRRGAAAGGGRVASVARSQ